MWDLEEFVGLKKAKADRVSTASANDPLLVFISYSRYDLEIIQQIDMGLRDNNYKTILDINDIRHLEIWRDQIQDQIVHCNAVIFAVSDNSLSSPTCQEELGIAIKNNKKIIPLAISPISKSLPEHIEEVNMIFAYNKKGVPKSGLYNAIKEICHNLQVNLEWSRMENILISQMERWTRRGKPRQSGYLMISDMLEDALEWVNTKPSNISIRQDISDYIETSRAHDKDKKKRFRNLWIGSGFFALIIGFSPTAIRILDDYKRSRLARRDTIMLALQADRYLTSSQPVKALMLALAADPANRGINSNTGYDVERQDIAHQRLLLAYEALHGEKALDYFRRLSRIQQVRLACAILEAKTGINLNELTEETIREDPTLLASIDRACP